MPEKLHVFTCDSLMEAGHFHRAVMLANDPLLAGAYHFPVEEADIRPNLENKKHTYSVRVRWLQPWTGFTYLMVDNLTRVVVNEIDEDADNGYWVTFMASELFGLPEDLAPNPRGRISIAFLVYERARQIHEGLHHKGAEEGRDSWPKGEPIPPRFPRI